jgi:CI repressor-like protein
MKRNVTAEKLRGGQPRISASRKREISMRLGRCMERLRCVTPAALADRVRIPRTTVGSWFRKKKGAATPTCANVIALAEEAGINPTWLLLGEGPELRGMPSPGDDAGEAVRAHVVRSLALELQVNPEFVAAVVPATEALLDGMVQQCRPEVQREVGKRRALDRSKSPLARALKSLTREIDPGRAREVEESLIAWWTVEQARLAALPPLERAATSDRWSVPLLPPLDIKRTGRADA